MEEKIKLRQKLQKTRQDLTRTQVEQKSEKIIKNLISYINWDEIKTINVFQTIKSNQEIEISSLLDFIKQNYMHIQISLAADKKSALLNIPEGRSYDLVVIPLIGFDRIGNRLGYGGGYYDRFLAKNNCGKAVGLAYSFQEVESLPVEQHDRKLGLIITEKEIINP